MLHFLHTDMSHTREISCFRKKFPAIRRNVQEIAYLCNRKPINIYI